MARKVSGQSASPLPWRLRSALKRAATYFTLHPDPDTFPGPDTYPGLDGERMLAETQRGPGRPPATLQAEQWAGRFRDLYAEQFDGFEFSRVDGEPPPAKFGVYLLVAIEDYAAHPERWSYDPEEHPKRAANRIRAAVLPLI